MRDRLSLLIRTIFYRLVSYFGKINRWILTAISIGVTVIVLGLLVYRQKDIIFNYQWQFRPIPILLSFLIYTLALFWASIVWGWIMNNLGVKIDFRKHIRYFVVSNLAKRIPGTIWYVASRFQFYLSDGLDGKIPAVASGMEIVLITLAGILVALVFSSQTLIEYKISPIILVFAFILGLLIIQPKVIQWMLLKRKVELNSLNYTFILKGIMFYIFTWILGGVVIYEFGNIIYPISIGDLPYIINAWTLVGIISTLLYFSPSNFGVTEIGLSLLLSKIVPSSIAVLIAIASRILMIIYEMVWAGIFILLKSPEKSQITQKD